MSLRSTLQTWVQLLNPNSLLYLEESATSHLHCLEDLNVPFFLPDTTEPYVCCLGISSTDHMDRAVATDLSALRNSTKN